MYGEEKFDHLSLTDWVKKLLSSNTAKSISVESETEPAVLKEQKDW